MSSSFVRDCSDSSGSNSGNTVIIIVQNNNQNLTLDEDLQEMIAGVGQDVSVLQMNNQELTDVTGDVVPTNAAAIDTNVLLNDSFAANFSIDGLNSTAPIIGSSEEPCTDFPIDADGLQKIESAFNSEDAKAILGESLVDFVNSPNPLMDLESLSPGNGSSSETTKKKKSGSPVRRSRRQMDKAEKEEVEKILAENQKMLQQEKEMLRLAELEKQKEIETSEEDKPETPKQLKSPVKKTKQKQIERNDPEETNSKISLSNKKVVKTAKNTPKNKKSPSLKNVKKKSPKGNLRKSPKTPGLKKKGITKELSVNLQKLQINVKKLVQKPKQNCEDDTASVNTTVENNEEPNETLTKCKEDNTKDIDDKSEEPKNPIALDADVATNSSEKSPAVNDSIIKSSPNKSPKIKKNRTNLSPNLEVKPTRKKPSLKVLENTSEEKLKKKKLLNALNCPRISSALSNFKIPLKKKPENQSVDSKRNELNVLKPKDSFDSVVNQCEVKSGVEVKQKSNVSKTIPVGNVSHKKNDISQTVGKQSKAKLSIPISDGGMGKCGGDETSKSVSPVINLVAKNVVSPSDSTLENQKSSHQNTTSSHLFQKQLKKRPSFEALLSMSDNSPVVKVKSNNNRTTFKAKSSATSKKSSNNSHKQSDMSQIRKSKREIKKKALDDEFVCPDESIEESEEASDEIDEVDDDIASTAEDSDAFNGHDDPGKLWCMCQKPHNHRFMICCDGCQNWFHGSCVGVTKAMGKIMEQQNEEWMCAKCTKDMENGTLSKASKAKADKSPQPSPKKKTKLKKWTETPETFSKDPSDARVLVYDTDSLIVRSGTAAPKLSELNDWLKKNPNYATILPSMTGRIKTDPKTGTKKLDMNFAQPDVVLLSSSPDQSSDEKKKEISNNAKKFSDKKQKKEEIYVPPKKIKFIDVDDIERDRKKKKEKPQKDSTKSPSEKQKTPITSPKPQTPVSDKNSSKMVVRDAVKKMLFEALDKRRQGVEKEFSDLTTDDLHTLCESIEEEIYRYFNKDVGFKYKSRYRSLVFNIKDAKNEGLFRKILSGDIKPSNLAKMTPEELASKELAEWRQRAEKKELEAIQKFELEKLALGNKFIMKSHKGEIAIDNDKKIENAVLKLPEEAEQESQQIKNKIRRRCSHSYDPACDQCVQWSLETNKEVLNKMSSISKDKDKHRHRHKSHKSSHKSKHSSDRRRSHEDKHSDRHSSKHSKKEKRRHSHSSRRHDDSDRERKKLKSDDSLKSNKDNDKSFSDASVIEVTSDMSSSGMLKKGSSPNLTSSLEESETFGVYSSPRTPPLPDESPPHEAPDDIFLTTPTQVPEPRISNVPVWRGCINMPEVAIFRAASFEVSGDGTALCTDIPQSVEVVGRINPETVWTYLAQIRKSATRDIVVLRFQPASEEEKVSYIALYSYLSSKRRYGVIGKCRKSVKDFYLVPLASHQAIPQVLLPFDGPGFDDNRPHMLVGIVIVTKSPKLYIPPSEIWPIADAPAVTDNPNEEAYSPPEEYPGDSPILVPEAMTESTYKEDQKDLLSELNKQIEKDRAEINEMQTSLDEKIENNRSSQPEIPEVVLPSNLQDILDNINKKEIAIKEKEIELEKHMNDNDDIIIDGSKDVDLRVLLPQNRPIANNNAEIVLLSPSYSVPQNFGYPDSAHVQQPFGVPSLHSMTDKELLEKANDMETGYIKDSYNVPRSDTYNQPGYSVPPMGYQGPPIQQFDSPRGHDPYYRPPENPRNFDTRPANVPPIQNSPGYRNRDRYAPYEPNWRNRDSNNGYRPRSFERGRKKYNDDWRRFNPR